MELTNICSRDDKGKDKINPNNFLNLIYKYNHIYVN